MGDTRVKWPGHGINHPPPSNVEVKELVQLNLYSPPSMPSWHVLGSSNVEVKELVQLNLYSPPSMPSWHVLG